MTAPISFVAYGVPQSKGSARAFIPKGWNRPVITSTNKGLKAWEHVVAAAAQVKATGVILAGPLRVIIAFYLPRPKSLPARVRMHTKRPDIDKLIRGSLDALTDVLWNDDSQIVELTTRKRYAEDCSTPRAEFIVIPLDADGNGPTELRPEVVGDF